MNTPKHAESKIRLRDGLEMTIARWDGGPKTPIFCIPGLTRNSLDFNDLAGKLAPEGWPVYALSLRGRGKSDYDQNYRNYRPETYCEDVLEALEQLDIREAIFIGTSLGGIVTMLANEAAPEKVHAAILNDIGPELAPEGIARIAGYVAANAGQSPITSLEQAAARLKEIHYVAFPDAEDAEWLDFAKRTFTKTAEGHWRLDYDPNISRALIENGPAPDLWPAFKSLKGKPTLVVRGAISDLLSPAIVNEMRKAHGSFDYVEVPRTGHAPMLTEPAAWDAIKKFLDALPSTDPV